MMDLWLGVTTRVMLWSGPKSARTELAIGARIATSPVASMRCTSTLRRVMSMSRLVATFAVDFATPETVFLSTDPDFTESTKFWIF